MQQDTFICQFYGIIQSIMRRLNPNVIVIKPYFSDICRIIGINETIISISCVLPNSFDRKFPINKTVFFESEETVRIYSNLAIKQTV